MEICRSVLVLDSGDGNSGGGDEGGDCSAKGQWLDNQGDKDVGCSGWCCGCAGRCLTNDWRYKGSLGHDSGD